MLAFDPLVEGRDLSTLRSIIVAGAPMDPGTMTACKERLQLKDLRQGIPFIRNASKNQNESPN